jgi:ABC-2 type transport system permease protein
MAADTALAPAPAPARTVRRSLHAERANVWLAVRQVWFGGLVIAASTGLLLWMGVKSYHKSQQSGGGLLAPLAENPAVRAIYGLPTAIDTLGGFAVWRVALFVTLLGTVWVTLATTRVLRGGEETGRLDLVLANPLSLVRATLTSLTAVFAVPVLTVLVAGAVLQGGGASAAGSWLYAGGLGLLVVTFMGLAALASQLLPERRRANGLAMGVLFATFVLRMWADGGTNSQWARWTTPFGWLEQLHAFGGNDLLPLVPLVAAPVVLVALALVFSGERDTGAGMMRAADTKQASTRLLSTPLAFAARRQSGELGAWAAAIAVLGLLSGGLAETLVGFPQSQPEATKLLQQVGMGAAITPGGFIAIMNVFYAVVLATYAIASVHADYEDEITNRLDLPYSNRVSRTAWSGSTALTTTAVLVVLTIVLALATWIGASAASAGLSIGDSFAAAANVLPVPILFLGLAMLLHGVRPSWAAGVASVLAIGLYMVELMGPALSWPTWVLDLSPYHHLALVPAETAEWTALVVMLCIAAACGVLGLFAYGRRDLQ